RRARAAPRAGRGRRRLSGRAILLGAGPSAGQARFPPPGRFHHRPACPMKLGIERLIEEPALRKPLAGRRVALLAHPASVTRDLTLSLDALAALSGVLLRAAFVTPLGLRD